MSLPDETAASAHTARILRRQMFSEELEKSARVRAEAGIVTTGAESAETEDAMLVHWARVAGR